MIFFPLHRHTDLSRMWFCLLIWIEATALCGHSFLSCKIVTSVLKWKGNYAEKEAACVHWNICVKLLVGLFLCRDGEALTDSSNKQKIHGHVFALISPLTVTILNCLQDSEGIFTDIYVIFRWEISFVRHGNILFENPIIRSQFSISKYSEQLVSSYLISVAVWLFPVWCDF